MYKYRSPYRTTGFQAVSTKTWEPMTLKNSSATSPSPASIPAKWLCQRPSCLPVLLEWSRAPPLHPLSPSHEQQYSPEGKWEDLVASRAKNELKFQEHVGFSFQFRCLNQKSKKEQSLQTFHGPSITSQHPRASLACQVEHKFCLKPLPHDAHKNLAHSQFKAPDSRALLNPMVSRVLGRLEAQDTKHRAHDAAQQRTRWAAT